MNFTREKFADILEEMKPLNLAHWDEVTMYKDIPLDVGYEVFLTLEKTGHLQTFCARIDGKLVGYAIFVINKHLHYKTTTIAVQDVVFIKRDCRGYGSRFINWCDDQLRENGVDIVTHHVKAKHNWGPMLERQGYELMDLIYAKRL